MGFRLGVLAHSCGYRCSNLLYVILRPVPEKSGIRWEEVTSVCFACGRVTDRTHRIDIDLDTLIERLDKECQRRGRGPTPEPALVGPIGPTRPVPTSVRSGGTCPYGPVRDGPGRSDGTVSG